MSDEKQSIPAWQENLIWTGVFLATIGVMMLIDLWAGGSAQ